jgi:hypothetical protein
VANKASAHGEAGEQNERRQHDSEKRRSADIDHRPAARARGGEGNADDRHREQPERQVDIKDPAPAQMFDKEAADQRPEHSREAEDAAKDSLVATALARREDIADRGHGDDDQPTPSEALQGAEGNELAHRPAEAAQRRAGKEQQDCRLEHDLAAEQISQLAVKRRDNRLREQIGGDDPGEVSQSAELADDRRQRRRDDRLIERCEQHHQQQRTEDRSDRPVPEPGGGRAG